MARGSHPFDAHVLREARIARGYSLNQLADAVECTKSQIAAYEAGRCAPEPPRLVALAEELHLKALDLMGVAEVDATLADLRAAAGHTADTAARALGISRNSYRPMECEGRFPHAREVHVAKLAALYGVDRLTILRAVTRIPAFAARRARLYHLADGIFELLWRERRPAILADEEILGQLSDLADHPREQVRRLVDFMLERGREQILASANAQARAKYAQDGLDRENAENLIRHFELKLKDWSHNLVASVEWLPDALTAREWKSLARLEHQTPAGLLWSADWGFSGPLLQRLLPLFPGLPLQRKRGLIDRAVGIQRSQSGVRIRLTAWGSVYGRGCEPLYAALYPQVQVPSGVFEQYASMAHRIGRIPMVRPLLDHLHPA